MAAYTATAKGWVKGQSLRYVKGHKKLAQESPAWRDGKKSIRGRELTYVGKGHPMAGTQRYVLTHRLVMSEALGRPLTSEEHVHHIDLDNTNNALGNLVILTRSEHKRVHCLIEKGVKARDALQEIAGVFV